MIVFPFHVTSILEEVSRTAPKRERRDTWFQCYFFIFWFVTILAIDVVATARSGQEGKNEMNEESIIIS
jgi:hypothetical protein